MAKAKQEKTDAQEKAQAFWKKSCEYFNACDENERLYSEAGLALYMETPLDVLGDWWDGKAGPEMQQELKMAYLRIQEQIDTAPEYREKGMVSRSNFLNKQKRFGGYQEKSEVKQDISIDIKFGKGMEGSDFD